MYRKALEEDPHDIGALFSYGRFLCEDKDDCEEGMKLYDRVLVEVFLFATKSPLNHQQQPSV
jgi:Tfp pilus assembly protein PilF